MNFSKKLRRPLLRHLNKKIILKIFWKLHNLVRDNISETDLNQKQPYHEK